MPFHPRHLRVAALAALACGAAHAAPVTLTFDDLTDRLFVGDALVASHGARFAPNAQALDSRNLVNRFGTSPSASLALQFTDTPSTSFTVTGGFTGTLSFWYATPYDDVTVTILDAAGTAVAGRALASTDTTGPRGDDDEDEHGGLPFDAFRFVSLEVPGTGRQVVLAGTPGYVLFDDIGYERSAAPQPPEAPANGVPLPGTPLLVLTGLAALGLARRRT